MLHLACGLVKTVRRLWQRPTYWCPSWPFRTTAVDYTEPSADKFTFAGPNGLSDILEVSDHNPIFIELERRRRHNEEEVERVGASFLESHANWNLFRAEISGSALGCPLDKFASKPLEEMSDMEQFHRSWICNWRYKNSKRNCWKNNKRHQCFRFETNT